MEKYDVIVGTEGRDKVCKLYSKDNEDIILFQFDFIQDIYCCGILRIGGIYWNGSHKEEVIDFLSKLKDSTTFFDSLTAYLDHEAHIQCSLVDETIIELFTEAGFKVLTSFVNVKTGNTVSILGLHIEETGYRDNEDEDYEEIDEELLF
jgi:hypothetical protein